MARSLVASAVLAVLAVGLFPAGHGGITLTRTPPSPEPEESGCLDSSMDSRGGDEGGACTNDNGGWKADSGRSGLARVANA